MTGRRWPDAPAVLTVLLALPVITGSLLLTTLLGTLVWPPHPWVVPAAWAVSGAVTFVPAFEHVLTFLSYDLHRPTPSQASVLTPSWAAVCAAAGVDGGRYRLWVENSGELNAFAAGGRTVAVTRAALALPPDALEAILAHELGHHLAGHSRATLLVWWYELPARLSVLVVRLVAQLVFALGRAVGGAAGVLVAAVLGLGVLAGLAFLDPWLLVMPLLSPVLAWSRRLGEYRADRMAARLGYGPVLVALLKEWITLNRGDRRRLWSRLTAGHPAHIDRIKRLREWS